MLTWYSPRPAEPTSSQTPFPQTELWWVQSSLQLSRVSPTLNQPVNFPETRWEVGRGVQKLVTRPDTLTRGSSRQEMSRPSEAKPLEYRRREEHNRKPWGPHQERKRRAARGRLHVGSSAAKMASPSSQRPLPHTSAEAPQQAGSVLHSSRGSHTPLPRLALKSSQSGTNCANAGHRCWDPTGGGVNWRGEW